MAAQESKREVRCPRLADHQERLRPAEPAPGAAVGRAAAPDLGRVALRFPRNRHARGDTESGAAVDSRGGPLRARLVGVRSPPPQGWYPKFYDVVEYPHNQWGVPAFVSRGRGAIASAVGAGVCVLVDAGQRRLTTAGACGTVM